MPHPNWSSANEQWKLSDGEILKAIACANEKFYIGTRSGKTSRYAVLDIDAKSKYHNKTQLDRLLFVLKEASLNRCSLYRSSFSGGWHLYIFFDEQISSADLRGQLLQLLRLNDFEVSKGTLEVFPHPGNSSLGMGLRLPLQPGFAWLDKATLEVEYEREELFAGKALELFIDVLESDANSIADYQRLRNHVQELESNSAGSANTRPLNNVIPIRQAPKEIDSEFAVHVGAIFQGLPPGINAETWAKGRQFHIEGLSGPSQRAESLFCLSHYLFYGDPSRDLPALGYGYEHDREWAIKEFLEARHNGFSADISRGRADALAQVERAAHWAPADRRGTDQKKYVAHQPIAWVRGNAKKKFGARRKIEVALQEFKKLGRSFTTVELEEAADVSRSTLYNHKDIWHQDYEDLAAGFFAICSDEYNAVEEAACSEVLSSFPESEKITPPGLLIARRIIQDLSLRNKRDLQNNQHAVLRPSEAAENEWRSKVASLTKFCSSELPYEKLKSSLVVLANYLSLAPYEEDAAALLPYVRQLRHELSIRARGPDRLESG